MSHRIAGCLSFLLTLFLACGGGATKEEVAEEPEQETIKSSYLCHQYLTDKAKADQKYRGKRVKLRGMVNFAIWSPDKADGLYLSVDTGTKDFIVHAWFDKEHEKAVLDLNLRKGEHVVVEGKVGTAGVGQRRAIVQIDLNECSVVAVGEEARDAK